MIRFREESGKYAVTEAEAANPCHIPKAPASPRENIAKRNVRPQGVILHVSESSQG
jgi:hypothetical protein